jgi:NADP-dependent 3-hydroxy acid dehydrogenase YdfG
MGFFYNEYKVGNTMTTKTWLITGTSTGFGRGLTERLLAQGDQVIATARNVAQITDFSARYPAQCLTLPLDVTAPEAAIEAVQAGVARFGSIDVLVNNAGYGYFATQEEGDLAAVAQMYEVNILGLVRTTQAVLPVMRQQNSGMIVNLSSIAGRTVYAGGGFYNSSKFAVEALSEALYYEVASFGIHVLVIEPGAFATDFGTRSAVRDLGSSASPYAPLRPTWGTAIAQVMPERQDPQEAITQILQAVQENKPFARVAVGKDAQRIIPLREQLGAEAFVALTASWYGL